MTQTIQHLFVVCVRNTNAEDLELRKLYQVVPDEKAAREGYLRVIDESGEDYLYPAEFFVAVANRGRTAAVGPGRTARAAPSPWAQAARLAHASPLEAGWKGASVSLLRLARPQTVVARPPSRDFARTLSSPAASLLTTAGGRVMMEFHGYSLSRTLACGLPSTGEGVDDALRTW